MSSLTICIQILEAHGEMFQKDLPLVSILSWLLVNFCSCVYATLLIPLINLTDRGLDYIYSLYVLQHLTMATINSTPRRRIKQACRTDHNNGLPNAQT